MILNDLCDLIVDCEHKTAPTEEAGYPSIRTPNIGRGYFILDGVNRVSEETYKLWTSRAIPSPGDLIMAREAPVGNVAMIPEGLQPCLGQRTLLIRPNKSKIDSRYLTYLLIGPHVQHLIHSQTNGATVAHLNMKDVRDLALPQLPSLTAQRKIAAILSAYDDMIENNTRRIAILEEMARLIYREWFVHFRFPGHEHAKFVDSELGRMPDGWAVVPASDAIEVDPKTTVPRDGMKPFVPMGSLSEINFLIDKIEERTGNGGSKFRNGDTLFARITPCLENGKTGFVHFLPTPEAVAFGSTEFIVLRSHKLCAEFVYLLARSDEFRDHAIKSMSGATGRQRVRSECFGSYYLALPPTSILKQFTDVVRGFFDLAIVLDKARQNLRQTRDLLLPRLISGELDVSGMEIAF